MDCSQVAGPNLLPFVTGRQALAVLKGLDRTPYVGRRWPRMAALRVESVRGVTVTRRAGLSGVQLRGLCFTSLEIESVASKFMPMY
jgi:hypothetical protein